MIGATLTTRLAQDGIDKKTVTAFTLAFLVYNLKFLWAWVVDGVRLPVLGRLGQRVSWMLVAGVLVKAAAVVNLALVDPKADIARTATLRHSGRHGGRDVRHRDRRLPDRNAETPSPRHRFRMSQYGWRIGSAGAARSRWWSPRGTAGYGLSGLRRVRAARDGRGVGAGRTAVIASRSRARWARRFAPSPGRSRNSSSGRAHCSCCCSSWSTRSGTRWPT